MRLLVYCLAGLGIVAAGGCAPMSALSYPVAGGPNPAPPPGYVVRCRAQPDVTFFLWPSYRTGCEQIISNEQPVVRARG